MEDDDGDDDGDDGDDGDDDDEEEEEAVEESANDLDTGALKRLMIMGTITVAMHLFLPKVPDAPAEEEAASQEEEPAAEEAAPSSEEEEAAEYVEEEGRRGLRGGGRRRGSSGRGPTASFGGPPERGVSTKLQLRGPTPRRARMVI